MMIRPMPNGTGDGAWIARFYTPHGSINLSKMALASICC